MLKVTSMSSHQRLAHLMEISESGISSPAMGEETAIQSTPTVDVSTPADRSGARPREETLASEEVEPPSKRIKAEPSVDTNMDSDQTQLSTVRTSGTSVQPPSGCQSASTSADRRSESAAPSSSKTGESSIVTNESDASNSSGSNSSLHEPASAGPQKAVSAGTSQIATAAPPSSTSACTLSPANASKVSHDVRQGAPPSSGPPQAAPKKATTMEHLRLKYLDELEYMLREFRKLERQLLGAKGAAQLEESAGSRERREKLHSFILHLEDTIRQIEEGCALQAEGQSIVGDGAASAEQGVSVKQESGAPIIDSCDDKNNDEESVRKLEEHILANLLPVKVRLKKQLAAQQGASRNPPGMPAPRRGSLQPTSAALGKGTFAAAAEERRKQAEAARLAAQHQHERAVRRVSDPSQFGKPLGGGGSSLTQKLHGTTLGSEKRTYGHGVGSSSTPQASSATTPTSERKILYAGMVPQSKQHQSGVSAASGVHELVIEDPNLIERQADQQELKFSEIGTAAAAHNSSSQTASVLPHSSTKPISPSSLAATPQRSHTLTTRKEPTSSIPPLAPEGPKKSKRPHEDENLSEQERRRLRKKRRKRKLRRIARRRERERQRQLAIHQQAQVAHGGGKTTVGKKKASMNKATGKKKGPRAVEYICALCSEAYASTCEFNPWWALAQHECPKCRKTQVPRIDIASPANTIEYHPALLAHADDNGGGGGGGSSAAANVSVMHVTQPASTYKPPMKAMKDSTSSILDSDSDSDLSELSDGYLSELSMDSDDDAADLRSMSPAEQAEHESFGYEYKGPSLVDHDASRLLVLMGHASTCPCKHKLSKHRDVCMSVKYMMLHVRDCPGTTTTFDVCPFPWCRKVKHLLYHLVSCQNPKECPICSPKDLSSSLRNLVGLNAFRMKSQRQRMIALARASLAAKHKVTPASNSRTSAAAKVSTKKQIDSSRVATSKTKIIHPYQKLSVYSKATAPVQIKSAATGAVRTPSAPATSVRATTKQSSIQSSKQNPNASRTTPGQIVPSPSAPVAIQGTTPSAYSIKGINAAPSTMPPVAASSMAQPELNTPMKVEPAASAKHHEPIANATSIGAQVLLQSAATTQGNVTTPECCDLPQSGNSTATNRTSSFVSRVNSTAVLALTRTANEGVEPDVAGKQIQFVPSVEGLQALANEISAGQNSVAVNLEASGMAELETLVGIPTLTNTPAVETPTCTKEENPSPAVPGTQSIELLGNSTKASSALQVSTATEVASNHQAMATMGPGHTTAVLAPAEVTHGQIKIEPAGGPK